ncbi:DUF2975 domain-containing protein [Secundilactobacillus folii]|nr:DUF2975 domain-containing protein [Secundilactobacillus folii]
MKSRLMKLVSLIACGSVVGFGSLVTWLLWQMAADTGNNRLAAQIALILGLVIVIGGFIFCTIQAWRLFSIINLEATFRYQTLSVLNWLKRGMLVVTIGLLIDWWPVYVVANHNSSPIMILIIVIITVLFGSVAILAAMFQDILITSHILSHDSSPKKPVKKDQ